VPHQRSLLAPIAIDVVLNVTDPGNQQRVDLKGTLEDTEMVDGLVFTMRSFGVNAPKRIEKANIGLIQFCISAAKLI